MEPEKENVLKEKMQKKINHIRRENSLPPLIFTKGVSDIFDRYSQNKATGRQLPALPEVLKGTDIVFISSPSIDLAVKKMDRIKSEDYDRAGLGLWFGRSADHPGGAYFVTLFLFFKNRYKDMDEDTIKDLVLKTINTLRKNAQAKAVIEDKVLSVEAYRLSQIFLSGKVRGQAAPRQRHEYGIQSFVTEDPTLFPRGTQEKISNPKIKKIGIGIGKGFDPETAKLVFVITIIYQFY
jgi:hypothetical protein